MAEEDQKKVENIEKIDLSKLHDKLNGIDVSPATTKSGRGYYHAERVEDGARDTTSALFNRQGVEILPGLFVTEEELAQAIQAELDRESQDGAVLVTGKGEPVDAAYIQKIFDEAAENAGTITIGGPSAAVPHGNVRTFSAAGDAVTQHLGGVEMHQQDVVLPNGVHINADEVIKALDVYRKTLETEGPSGPDGPGTPGEDEPSGPDGPGTPGEDEPSGPNEPGTPEEDEPGGPDGPGTPGEDEPSGPDGPGTPGEDEPSGPNEPGTPGEDEPGGPGGTTYPPKDGKEIGIRVTEHTRNMAPWVAALMVAAAIASGVHSTPVYETETVVNEFKTPEYQTETYTIPVEKTSIEDVARFSASLHGKELETHVYTAEEIAEHFPPEMLDISTVGQVTVLKGPDGENVVKRADGSVVDEAGVEVKPSGLGAVGDVKDTIKIQEGTLVSDRASDAEGEKTIIHGTKSYRADDYAITGLAIMSKQADGKYKPVIILQDFDCTNDPKTFMDMIQEAAKATPEAFVGELSCWAHAGIKKKDQYGWTKLATGDFEKVMDEVVYTVCTHEGEQRNFDGKTIKLEDGTELTVVDKDGNLLEKGSEVIGSDGKTYTLNDLQVDQLEHKENTLETRTEERYVGDKVTVETHAEERHVGDKVTWSVTDATAMLALGALAVVAGSYIYTSKKNKEAEETPYFHTVENEPAYRDFVHSFEAEIGREDKKKKGLGTRIKEKIFPTDERLKRLTDEQLKELYKNAQEDDNFTFDPKHDAIRIKRGRIKVYYNDHDSSEYARQGVLDVTDWVLPRVASIGKENKVEARGRVPDSERERPTTSVPTAPTRPEQTGNKEEANGDEGFSL